MNTIFQKLYVNLIVRVRVSSTLACTQIPFMFLVSLDSGLKICKDGAGGCAPIILHFIE